MNMNTESTPNEIKIVWLRRISQSQPTAWEGRTRNQETVHVFYKFGQLEVWMRQDLKGMPGTHKWVTILNFHPEWLETELEIERNLAETRRIRGGSLANAKGRPACSSSAKSPTKCGPQTTDGPTSSGAPTRGYYRRLVDALALDAEEGTGSPQRRS